MEAARGGAFVGRTSGRGASPARDLLGAARAVTRERRFAVLGAPIEHSASPAMHAAAFASMGLPHRYEAVLCPTSAELGAAVHLLRQGRLDGLNVTAPHKETVLGLVDRIDPSAAEIGAANTLVRAADGAVVAHNTDAVALCRELSRLAPRLGSVVILGAGGAARAALSACLTLGARLVTVTTRSWTNMEALEGSGRAEPLRARGALLTVWPGQDVRASGKLSLTIRASWDGTLRGCDLVVQCTPGRGPEVARAIAFRSLPSHAVAYDLVYDEDTAFLRGARASGLVAEGGVGMLVEQGALAFERWLGVSPPRDVMRAAVLARLAHG